MLDIYILFEYNIHMMNITKNHRGICLVISATALVAGLLIYILLREDTYLHVFANAFFNIKPLRFDNYFADFLKYYFVDFLWSYSLSFLLTAVSSKITLKKIFLIAVVSSILGLFFELAQLFSIVNGVFDLCDVGMYVAASVLYVAVNIKLFKR